MYIVEWLYWLRRIMKRIKKYILKLLNIVCYRLYRMSGKRESILEKVDEELIFRSWTKNNSHCYIQSRDEWSNHPELDLSIIVPLYNSEQFIHRNVDSLLAQKTYFKYEIILVNDGSKDSTQRIVEKYRDENLEKIVAISQDNGGISCARNIGIANSKGGYISFVDQDDWVSEDYVEKMISTAYAKQADIVKAGFCDIYTNRIRNRECNSCVAYDGMKDRLFCYKSYVYPGVYRRELFEHIQFPVGYWYEDMIIRSLVFRQAKVFVHIPNVLYFKRFHSSNSSFTIWDVKNNKSIEHLYLSMDIIEVNDLLNLPRDIWLYECLMREYGFILSLRIRYLEENIRKNVFLKACDILSELYKDEYYEELSDENREWQSIFANREYKMWKLKCGHYFV